MADASYLSSSSDPTLSATPASRGKGFDVFMLGWEFPPFISGGLGTACYGLTRAMSARGDRVLFVMPGPSKPGFSVNIDTHHAAGSGQSPEMSLPEMANVTFQGLGTRAITAYARPISADPPHGRWPQHRPADVASAADPTEHARGFADLTLELAQRERSAGRTFDVVHAHDWITFDAGRRAADVLGAPLIAHVHSTEYDRSGDLADPRILDAEASGLANADAVISVSGYTADILADRYGLDRSRIHVIHNAADADPRFAPMRPIQVGAAEQIVLFVGRLTHQKNPLGFVRAAALVIEQEPATRFVVAGSGELAEAMRRLAIERHIDQHFLFAGFLRGGDVDRVYASASLLVMPSVSEPFGLVSVEAMNHSVPVIVSRQSGAAEALDHVLTVDFWDTEELASRIVSVLRDPALHKTLAERGSFEVRQMRWTDAADAVEQVYAGLLEARRQPFDDAT